MARVIAGHFAGLVVPKARVSSCLLTLGPFTTDGLGPGLPPYYLPDSSKNKALGDYLLDLKKKGESVGATVRTFVKSPPPGLGEPVFHKLKSDLAKAVTSIGGLTACSFGKGIAGGISDGEDISLDLTFKPPSTVGEKAKQGRHDPCLVPRAVPVVEAMVTFVLADHYLRQRAYENFCD